MSLLFILKLFQIFSKVSFGEFEQVTLKTKLAYYSTNS